MKPKRIVSTLLLGTAVMWLPVISSADAAGKKKARTNFSRSVNDEPGSEPSRPRRGANSQRGGSFSFFRWNWRSTPSDAALSLFKRKIKPEPVLTAAALMTPMTQVEVDPIETERPSEPIATALYERISGQAETVFKVPATDADPVAEFYKARDFAPLWVDADGLNIRAKRLLKQLSLADEDGLRKEAYLPPMLDGFDVADGDVLKDAGQLALLDLHLTRVALLFARHISTGRVDPGKISRNIDLKPEAPAPATILASLDKTVRPGVFLQSLAPRTRDYAALKAALAKYRLLEQAGGWTRVPAIAKLQPGKSHRAVVQLRQRLIEGGFHKQLDVEPEVVDHDAENAALPSIGTTAPSRDTAQLYDKGLVVAVKAFQKKHGLSVDGIVGGRTVAALNKTATGRVAQLIVNMERRRWLPVDLGSSHVLVNQAAFRMTYISNGEVAHSARVIVGKRSHQTVEFNNKMQFVVLNPYWNVPRSIATQEMLPHMLVSGGLSESYEVFGPGGRKVSSTSVDWDDAADAGFPYSIRQRPGPGNALGNVKFLFPNKHNIYLHDTPSRSLFSRAVRSLSHGCVRVQNANKLALTILDREGWTNKRVRAAMASGKNQSITLKKAIPVYLTYQTAWLGKDGNVVFGNDFYGRDQRLKIALGQFQLAMK